MPFYCLGVEEGERKTDNGADGRANNGADDGGRNELH